ncbi:hypothetical protein BD560DRAFT_424542 [Blakeslea trispora]|nr:hypothetical protein BD560DRAFT_424542 [Blakeslea trispora]
MKRDSFRLADLFYNLLIHPSNITEGTGEDIYEQNKQAIGQFLKSETSHAKALLDKTSIRILQRFDELKVNDIHVLKYDLTDFLRRLSMSYIVDTTENNEKVFKRYIDNDFFWQHVDRCQYQPLNYLSEAMKADIRKICDNIIKEAKRGINFGLVAVLKERLALAEKDETSSVKYQALQAMIFLLHGFQVWPKSPKESEAQRVSRVDELINIIFKDYSLKTKTGETVGNATKKAYRHNESSYSSFCRRYSLYKGGFLKRVYQYKLLNQFYLRVFSIQGLVVKDNQDAELAFCEFKADFKTTTVSHQQSKTLRLNLTILQKMKEVFIDKQLFSFVWTGSFGIFFSLQEYQDVFIARPANPFVVPVSLVQLDEDFCDTIITLLHWKHHLVETSEELFRAESKPQRRKMESPDVCFTVVHQKKRKT